MVSSTVASLSFKHGCYLCQLHKMRNQGNVEAILKLLRAFFSSPYDLHADQQNLSDKYWGLKLMLINIETKWSALSLEVNHLIDLLCLLFIRGFCFPLSSPSKSCERFALRPHHCQGTLSMLDLKQDWLLDSCSVTPTLKNKPPYMQHTVSSWPSALSRCPDFAFRDVLAHYANVTVKFEYSKASECHNHL